jgi:hypothetical protein
MLNKLIIFLLRKKLGLKKNDEFFFTNQKIAADRYYFTDNCLMKYDSKANVLYKAHVSLNWLLDKDCSIVVDNSGDWIKELLKKTIL